ncbi:tRNA threonylcarbamoyladenosine dehydratase [Planococcus sp. CP5-4]|uniref:tRNA threonylcarbamoyladenosine dehydratase n=1 Tax=unclassified Planococcus (in: firmicutes) TaxID=2662419 RepID=UPI001C24D925|nr:MULTISPECIES: tRNA threonylcarbamoyladenosine dehydratase [unclassified Planococcus (in: firmicutes)]MBU9672863.1 tRNA threonylcarbamoyladenosine dehydratase [Planococcus sp. CP5-4_YE]MBV0908635.1 tRNA threonylcarbamoyladenosine dehydratase [Planococcus sp. CP5-4_UN]MBW6063404.1 tRNA threonylcarbamoyladenosine dehydratase [Planococcus sp. CP5-4]
MLHQFSRNELAIGKEGMDLVKGSTVAILGVGGVGSFAAEACARSGVGKIILVDKDDVDITNINRQLVANLSTVGQSKVEVMKKRIEDVNAECEVVTLHMFYTEDTYEEFFSHKPDYVIDASDTLIYKVHLIKECYSRRIPIISSMGAANKTDPTRFKIADISKTHTDPLAKMIRKKLKQAGIRKGVPVIFSDESPIVVREDVVETVGKKDAAIRKAQMPPSSNAFTPSTVGLIAASWVVNQMTKSIHIQRVNQ